MRPICKADGVAACPVRPWDSAEMRDQRRHGGLDVLGVPR